MCAKQELYSLLTLDFCQKFEHFQAHQDSDKLQVQRMKILRNAPKLSPILRRFKVVRSNSGLE